MAETRSTICFDRNRPYALQCSIQFDRPIPKYARCRFKYVDIVANKQLVRINIPEIVTICRNTNDHCMLEIFADEVGLNAYVDNDCLEEFVTSISRVENVSIRWDFDKGSIGKEVAIPEPVCITKFRFMDMCSWEHRRLSKQVLKTVKFNTRKNMKPVEEDNKDDVCTVEEDS